MDGVGIGEKGGVQAAVDDVDVGPAGVGAPAEELGAAELGDADDEMGEGDFIGQGPAEGVIEFLRAVDGEGEGGAAQEAAEGGDGGGVGAEVGVEVGYATGAAVGQE